MKWNQKLHEYGLNPEKAPKDLRKMFAQYQEIQEGLEGAEEEIERLEPGSAEHTEASQNAAEMQEALEAMDETMCEMIEKWKANRDRLVEMARQNGDKIRGRKRGEASPAPAPAPPAPPAPGPAPVKAAGGTVDEPKKKSGVGALILGVVVLAATFGAVNYFSQKE